MARRLFRNDNSELIRRGNILMAVDGNCCCGCCSYQKCGGDTSLLIGNCLEGMNINDIFTSKEHPLDLEYSCYQLVDDGVDCLPVATFVPIGPHDKCPECFPCPCTDCLYYIDSEEDLIISGVTSTPELTLFTIQEASDHNRVLQGGGPFDRVEMAGREVDTCSELIQPTPFYSYTLTDHEFYNGDGSGVNNSYSLINGSITVPDVFPYWSWLTVEGATSPQPFTVTHPELIGVVNLATRFDMIINFGIGPTLKPNGFPYTLCRTRYHQLRAHCTVSIRNELGQTRNVLSWDKIFDVPAGQTIFDFNPLVLDINDGAVGYRDFVKPLCGDRVPVPYMPIDSPSCIVTVYERVP